MDRKRNFGGLFAFILIVALVVIGAGYSVTHSTYLAPYRTVTNGRLQGFIAGSTSNGEIAYLRIKGDNSVYAVPTAQITPKFGAKSFSRTSHITLTVLPDSTGIVDVKASKTIELKGPAFRVVAIAVTTGKKTILYATSQYTHSPYGYPHDQIHTGNQITTLGFGVLAFFIVLVGMFGRKAKLLDLDDFVLPIPSIPELAFGLAAGVFFIMFNLPGVVSKLARTTGWSFMSDMSSTTQSVNSTLISAFPGQPAVHFDALWSKFLLVLAGYLALLAVLSLRHLRVDLFALGAIFLTVGATWLHIVTWLVAALVWVFRLVVSVLIWVLGLVAIVLGFIGKILGVLFSFIAGVIRSLVEFLITHGWWVFITVLLLIGVIYLAVRYRKAILEFFGELWGLVWENLRTLGIFILVSTLLLGIGFLLWKLIQLLWVWLALIFAFLGKVLAIIVLVLIYVLVVYLIAGVIFGLGALLLDQFRGAWRSGNGRRGVILGSLAIGVSLALIGLEANLYGATAYFPAPVTAFATTYVHQSAPILDLLVAFAVVVISSLALVRNLVVLGPEPDLSEFQLGVAMTLIVVPLIAILIFLVASQQPSTST